MKAKRNYIEESNRLAKAIEIAIDAFTVESPSNWEISQLEHIKLIYREMKNKCLYPEPQFKNLSSLNYIVNEAFTYFQESSGPTVEYFWRKIKEENLEFERTNKLKKILKQGRVKDEVEFNFIVDMIVVAEQIGMTTPYETEKLNLMLSQYEQKRSSN